MSRKKIIVIISVLVVLLVLGGLVLYKISNKEETII